MDAPRITEVIGPIHTGNLEAGLLFRNRYNLVINVNDAFLDTSTHWFPINEVAPWGYAPFFYVKRVVDSHLQKNAHAKILIHCAAGAERSPMMAFCYMISVGMTPEEIDWCYHVRYADRYRRLIEQGIIPSDLPAVYKTMESYLEHSLMGVLARTGDPRR